MPIHNQDIRGSIKESGFPYWLVAEKYGIGESTFSRRLRKELPPEEKEKILAIIEELKGEN